MIEKFAGGQSNPTYRISGDGIGAVLRRKPFGQILASAHAIDREFRLISALYPQGFPVPQPIALCEDAAIIGTSFYVMQLVEGDNFQDGTLPVIAEHRRKPIYESMMRTLARLHAIEPGPIGLSDFGRPGNYFERQVGRWTKQYRAAQTDVVREIESLIAWLPSTIPQQSGMSVIHGDYRIDNLIFDGCDVAAVLDWELATIGDPMADLSYAAMNWIMPSNGNSGLGGVDLEAHMLPALDQAVSIYEDERGVRTPRDLSWYFAFNLFRLCAILQGIKRRVLDGNASNMAAASTAELIQPYARIAWEQALLAGAR